MKIFFASVMGFCFGVRRAVELAEKALNENPDKPVFSLGALIHNEKILFALEKKGLKIADENEIHKIPEGSVVIIRAHGVAAKIFKILEEKKCIIIDATCPRVKTNQKTVERYSLKNDCVILTGDKNHSEVIGIAGYAGKNFRLIQDFSEAQKLNDKDFADKNIILLSQTTYSPAEFEKIENYCKTKFKKIAVMNTICPATNERQNALLELCKKVDGVLVIGGKNSANTKRLFQTAEKNCKNAAYIQTSQDIPKVFFEMENVGITAGASTPDEIIFDVEKCLKEKQKKQSFNSEKRQNVEC